MLSCNAKCILSLKRGIYVGIIMTNNSLIIILHSRIAWVIVVIGVVVVFSYAITTRLQHLYTYPTSIDLTVGYWPRVPFPAVTICNQNKYR